MTELEPGSCFLCPPGTPRSAIGVGGRRIFLAGQRHCGYSWPEGRYVLLESLKGGPSETSTTVGLRTLWLGSLPNLSAATVWRCRLRSLPLSPGDYKIELGVNSSALSRSYDVIIDLDAGRVVSYGPSDDVVEQYLARALEHRQARAGDLSYYRRGSGSDKQALFVDLWVGEARGEVPDVEVGRPISVRATMEARDRVTGANVTVAIKKQTGEVVTTVFSWDSDFKVDLAPGRTELSCTIYELNLPPGLYLIDAGVSASVGHGIWDVILDCPAFRVVNTGEHSVIHRPDRPGAVFCPRVSWRASSAEE